jgi:hypothetical protein
MEKKELMQINRKITKITKDLKININNTNK